MALIASGWRLIGGWDTQNLALCLWRFGKDEVNPEIMYGTNGLGQMEGLASKQLNYGQLACFRGKEERVVVGIDCLREF